MVLTICWRREEDGRRTRKAKWEQSKGASKTEVSGQLVRIMVGKVSPTELTRASEDRLL